MKEKWIEIRKGADFKSLSEQHTISPVMARLIINRGVCQEQMGTYLRGTIKDFHSPWGLKDMEKAVACILSVCEEHGKIAISSDFDCDGIFSAYILNQGLCRLGVDNEIFTPNRVDEGYGVNRRIIDSAKKNGARLILTCDNGIAAINEISYAKQLGMSVVVTDHHEVQDDLPEADAIVDPKQQDCQYEFDGLCGAGVAYKLILALYEKAGIPLIEAQSLLQYVAIATVADVMDLVDENRIIVKEGLRLLAETENVGMRALIAEQCLQGKTLRAYHIGFVLGPCFNASGRLSTVDMAFALLNEKDTEQAAKLAKELKELNDCRKEMTEKETRRAISMIEESGAWNVKVLVVTLPGCHESLVGIIAGRLKEKYYRPVIVFTNTEDGLLKGSGRSIESYDMFAGLKDCESLMERFGGHKMAAGMTIKSENFKELKSRLNKKCVLSEEELIKNIMIDVALPIGFISERMLEELNLLEPFGKGNTKPIFAERHFKILGAKRRGMTSQVLVMDVRNESGTRMDALLFDEPDAFDCFLEEEFGREEVEKMYQGKNNAIDIALAYYPSVNEYRGIRTFQIQVISYCRIPS